MGDNFLITTKRYTNTITINLRAKAALLKYGSKKYLKSLVQKEIKLIFIKP
jgi:hypothetical protein